jgi:hypothetical protein
MTATPFFAKFPLGPRHGTVSHRRRVSSPSFSPLLRNPHPTLSTKSCGLPAQRLFIRFRSRSTSTLFSNTRPAEFPYLSMVLRILFNHDFAAAPGRRSAPPVLRWRAARILNLLYVNNWTWPDCSEKYDAPLRGCSMSFCVF